MTIIAWYRMFLRINETAFKQAINLYNMGLFSDNARKALEIIDGLPMDD